ncbi:hypothetical protein JCM6882_006163 [Rhodosporidiobolus microsporus]
MLEKGALPPPAAAHKAPNGRGKQALLFLAVAGLCFFRFFGGDLREIWTGKPLVRQEGAVFWSICPDSPSTYCSFLNVPLDYTNPSPAETVSLALRMIPATVPPKEQLGYLFMNPGGPGGSGTGAVVDLGPLLTVVFEGRYNLVSWDPRGVNLTAPALGCFETDGDANRFTRDTEQLGLSFEARGSPALGFDSHASEAGELAWVAKVDGFARSLHSACDTNASQRMLRASSSAFTARDLKSIAEALGEEKVNYWGFSYGTILGATFAAMFPDQVGRFILDGVSDAEAYTNDLFKWGKLGMNKTRKVYEGFWSHCATSGPSGCAFARENSTAEDLEERYDALLESLREAPAAVGKSAVGPGTLTPSDVIYTMFHALYQPLHWPHMASMLNATDHGEPSELYEVANVASSRLGRKIHKNPFHRAMSPFLESTAAIMCSDTDPKALVNSTVRDMAAYMKEMRESTKSPTADVWAIWLGACRHWSATALERYSGPWSIANGLNRTANPILFFSQTADPVTPLPSAQKMSAAFGEESARLLVQEGYGHCSFAHPSICTAKRMRAYLLDGVLPAPDTVCEGDPNFIFPRPGEKVAALETLSDEDRELQAALEELAERAIKYRMGPH